MSHRPLLLEPIANWFLLTQRCLFFFTEPAKFVILGTRCKNIQSMKYYKCIFRTCLNPMKTNFVAAFLVKWTMSQCELHARGVFIRRHSASTRNFGALSRTTWLYFADPPAMLGPHILLGVRKQNTNKFRSESFEYFEFQSRKTPSAAPTDASTLNAIPREVLWSWSLMTTLATSQANRSLENEDKFW